MTTKEILKRKRRPGRKPAGTTGEAYRCAQMSRVGMHASWAPKYIDVSIEVLARIVDQSSVVHAFEGGECKVMNSLLAFELAIGKHSRQKVAASAMNRSYERAFRKMKKSQESDILIELHDVHTGCAWEPARQACCGIRCNAAGLSLWRAAAAELKFDLENHGFVKCV
jgi:hypothetical protein